MAKTDRRNGSVLDMSFGATTVTAGAPTVAEVTALTRIECAVVGDGSVSTTRSPSYVDIAGLCDFSSAQLAGRVTNDPIEIPLFREFDGTDEFWVLFDDTADPRPIQTLVVCRAGYTGGVVTAADVVDIYTVQVAARSPQDVADGDAQAFDASLSVITAEFDVAIVA